MCISRRPAFALAILPILLSTVAHAGGVKVTSIQPGYVRVSNGDNTVNLLLLSGSHLSKVSTCDISPVTSTSTILQGVKCDPNPGFIQGTGQLKVTVNLPKGWPIGNLLLTLNDKQGKPLAVATVLATSADPQSPLPSPQAPSGGGQASSPFAACINANATSSVILNPPTGSTPPNVNCASSLLTESEVSDNFGQHVAHTYYAIQVRVANQNSNFDFLLRDILLTLPDGRVVSGRIRRFAQGVAVKGKSLDRRAAFYNSLQAGTGLYGALAIFASTGFKTVGNVLQGSFLSGFSQIFPDYTADNVNRFNTAVFDDQNPSIVPKDSIGQPPLYVVALVPKLPEMRSDPHYGERIAVAVEGTYIKQVSLVALSTSSLDFGYEFISPDSIGNWLSTNDPKSALAALRAKGTERSFTISNNNSSPMNISKVTISTVTPSTTALKSDLSDFEIDGTKTTCSQSTPGTPFNPNNAFTIAAQSYCTIFVRFHPIGIGASQATLNLEGSTLDGPRSVSLNGKSVGLILKTASIALKNGTTSPSFACSYQDT